MQQSDINALLQMMQTPAGQQLLQFLRKNGGTAAQEAVTQAAAGNYTGAKDILAPLLQDPQLRSLLQQLGGTP